MKGLMLEHTSGHCSREQAFSRVLIPEETRTYQPLPNKVMLDIIYKIAQECDITLSNEQLGMDLKGQRFFGVCDIEGQDFLGDRIKMMIGFCNSYNGTMSSRFCIGGSVLVCSNKAFYAYTDDITGISAMAMRPHKNLNNLNIYDGLVKHIREAFDQIEVFKNSQESFYGGLLEREIKRSKAYETIVRAAQAGVINKTKVLTIAEEWDRQKNEPNDIETYGYEWYREFKDSNAYSLFNAFTQIGKIKLAANPVQSHISTIGLTNFFREEFKL